MLDRLSCVNWRLWDEGILAVAVAEIRVALAVTKRRVAMLGLDLVLVEEVVVGQGCDGRDREGSKEDG